MKTAIIKHQKSSDKMWIDEKGMEIPFTRVNALERFQEKSAYKLYQEANLINEQLAGFKAMIKSACEEVYAKVMEQYEVKVAGKGNFTWFNFDRSIKIEVNINDNISFDDALIAACQAKLSDFLDDEMKETKDYIRPFITDAFNKSRGGLDAKKVLGLLKHKQKIKAKLFHEACELLEQSVRRNDSRTYWRVSVRNADGKYDVIDLNFSSIL